MRERISFWLVIIQRRNYRIFKYLILIFFKKRRNNFLSCNIK